MTVASSSERVIDDSVHEDFTHRRESGIVDVAGGSQLASSQLASSQLASSQLGADVIHEARTERRPGAQPLDTETVKTMTPNAVSSTEVSASREPVARNPGYRGALEPSPADRERLERQASPVGSAVSSGGSLAVSSGIMSSGASLDADIDIATDDAPGHSGASSGDDGTIEVADDEIETAEPSSSGHALLSGRTLPSPASSMAPPSSAPYSSLGATTRSRPPAPPSTRPRKPMPSLSGVSLPLPMPANGVSPSSRPSVDPWALANKTLELAHANGRILELEEQVAYRDARIVELEENLARARRKLEDIEQRSRPVTLPAGPAAARAAERGRASTASEAAPPTPVVVKAPAPVAASAGAANGSNLDGSDRDGSARTGRLLAVGVERGNGHFDADREGEDDGERDSGFGDGAAIARDGSEDDLQQISGIGPRFEAALRKQGITRLSQIAAWSESDVRQVAKALKIPKSRIVKGRWIEVAREVIGTRAASE